MGVPVFYARMRANGVRKPALTPRLHFSVRGGIHDTVTVGCVSQLEDETHNRLKEWEVAACILLRAVNEEGEVSWLSSFRAPDERRYAAPDHTTECGNRWVSRSQDGLTVPEAHRLKGFSGHDVGD